MNKILPLLLLGAVAAMPASARKKHQWTTVEKPATAYSFRELLTARSVEYCDTCTRITLGVGAPMSWNLAPTTRIVANGKVLPVRRGTALQNAVPTEAAPNDTTRYEVPFVLGRNYFGAQAHYYMDGVDRLTTGVVLEFPPLPKGTTVVDLDEGIVAAPDGQGNSAEQFRLTGIRIDGKNYPALLEGKQEAAEPFRWTAPETAEAKECRVRVNIIGEHLPANLTITPIFYAVDRSNPLMTSLTEPKWEPATDGTLGGTATFTFAVPTPYLVYPANSRLDVYYAICVPGEETVLTIDYNTLHTAATDPTAQSIGFHNLSYADGRDFNLLLPDGTKGNDNDMFRADLTKRATNPDVAALRLKERTDAEALLARCGKLEEVAEAEVATVAAPYRDVVTQKWQASCELRAKMLEGKGGKICDVPVVAPAEMVKAIVAQYKGKAVYVDLWATWCGPCKQGIKAMKPHHDDFSADDVQFVYITDESSPADQWNEMVVDMPGHHYRLKSMDGLDPAITGIPRYLIFDREGNLSYDQEGFGRGGEEKLLDEIRKAMGE